LPNESRRPRGVRQAGGGPGRWQQGPGAGFSTGWGARRVRIRAPL